jgi:hypothetical protein
MQINQTTKQLKALAEVLTYKADIYGPFRRIYGWEAEFRVVKGELFHGETKLDPSTLRDGHGRRITADSNY